MHHLNNKKMSKFCPIFGGLNILNVKDNKVDLYHLPKRPLKKIAYLENNLTASFRKKIYGHFLQF